MMLFLCFFCHDFSTLLPRCSDIRCKHVVLIAKIIPKKGLVSGYPLDWGGMDLKPTLHFGYQRNLESILNRVD
jgi:hypothetical protein